MNRVETWKIDADEATYDIESTINNYCEQYKLNPISISVVYDFKRDYYTVFAVVED